MKKSIRSLLCSNLLLLVAISTVFAQGGAVAKESMALIVKGSSNALAKQAVERMLPRIITGDIGVAVVTSEVIAAAPIKNAIKINSFSLPATLSTRMEVSPGAVKTSALTIEQMTRLLIEPDPQVFARFNALEKETFFLKGIPAATVEWPIVLSAKQQAQAIEFYRQLLHETSTSGQVIGIDGWAKKMAAITDLGLFGEGKADADAILQAAKSQRSTSPFCGTTDIITVRALLNLRAYDHIQALADYRLADAGKLSTEWHGIKKYMKQAGLELEIPAGKIAPARTRPTIADSPTTIQWLRYYNDYNVFHIDPSAETTADFLKLRQAILENQNIADVQAQIVGELKPKGPTTIVMVMGITPTPKLQEFVPQDLEAAEKEALGKYTPDQLREMAQQQEQLLQKIHGGFLQARYNIGPKQVFYPYGQAMARAEVEGNQEMLSLLKQCEGVNDFYFSRQPAQKLGLTEEEAEEVVAGIIQYVQETTALMYMGYSWGTKPITEVMIPSKYHSENFGREIEQMLSTSGYYDRALGQALRKAGFPEDQIEKILNGHE